MGFSPWGLPSRVSSRGELTHVQGSFLLLWQCFYGMRESPIRAYKHDRKVLQRHCLVFFLTLADWQINCF